MGVDVSTWRARVGMFIQRTSQKSLLVFRAQDRNQLPNHHQSPWPSTKYSIPCLATDREFESIQQNDYKPNSAQPAYKAYSHVPWVLFSFILLFFALLVDFPSAPRPPLSCPPLWKYPDQNETSPVQLSYVQLLMILMCGDVEVNPGPPVKRSFADIAGELTKFIVPVEDVIYPEYCSKFDVNFTLKRKDRGYTVEMKNIVQTVCAMLNYAGGVITLNPQPQTANTDKDLDEWEDKITKELEFVVEKEVSRCVEIKRVSGHIEIWLRKSWKFITYKLPLYIRRGNGTQDGHVSMISEGVKTEPSSVSKVANIQWQQLNHGDRFPLSEGLNLEFKAYKSTCDATSLMAKITKDEIRGEPKLIKTLLAFTNTEGGGDAIIGIKEDAQGAPILEGQNLPAADEGEVQRCFNELMIKGLNGEKRIWPSAPNGSEWTINFYPLKNCLSNNRHVLIHIRVHQVAGYVLGGEPEAYTMTPEGNIRHVPVSEWRDCINPSFNKSAPELLELRKQDNDDNNEEQDNDEDDIDEEQFKQLVNDLKSHRVTLSLKHIKSASWTKDSENTQDDIVTKPGVNIHTCVEEVSKSELLMPTCPTTWVPDKTILDRWVANNHPGIKQCVEAIGQSHAQQAVVIGSKCLGHLFPELSLELPPHHVFDFFELQGSSQIDLWIAFGDYRDIATCKKYANSAIRILRSQLLTYMHEHTDRKAINLAISAKIWSMADKCIKYETTVDYTKSNVELPVLQKAIAYCLLQGQSHIKNRLGEEYLTALTKDQLSACLHYDYRTVMVFQGPPGSGKSIIAQHLCDKEARNRNISKDKILYICPCQPLAQYIKFQDKCEVKFTKSKKLVRTIREALKRGILLIIVDDAHMFQCSRKEWSDLVKLFEPRDKGSTERHLAIFLDPVYQNFKGDKVGRFFEAIAVIYFTLPFSYVDVRRALPVMIRNSRNIFTFFKENAEDGGFALACSHDFQGDGVFVNYISENFFCKDTNNPIIKTTKEIVGQYNFEESITYKETDITILVDSNGRGEAGKAVQKLHKIFGEFYPEAKVQRAFQFPVQGIVIDELISFSGLDTRVCILVLTSKDTSVMSNPRYKCFVASRGITKLVFMLHGDTLDSSFRQLKLSEVKQWQKLSRQLLKEIPEKGSSDEWLKTNVPDTECWHNVKPFVIVRCQKKIHLDNPRALAEWVDINITPALRQDPQYVRAVIGSTCKRTIWLADHEVDSEQLRAYLGILNCLYGAPESLQHQALDSVYDLVESQHHPKKVLNKILDIMWSDGYIHRLAIRSWYDNKRKTCEIGMQGKGLGELVQERVRSRQGVRRWMEDTTEVRTYYTTALYNFPHYQRVVLHALCQLAVTWQGDKCTVDKDLLFHYIPQLFCHVEQKIQLLYAVQCVLYHLQNPPGLVVAVLQAVLIIIKPDTGHDPLITTTDWDKWRNTQNPLYEEGRNIIQQQGHILDLIVLISSGQTLTEINGWISANIPQDQMHDAFIITVECLINREEEVIIRDWISQNVPQSMETVVRDTLQTIVIQNIPLRADDGLISWMERHILPAWRQDAQFVRAAMKGMCERAIKLDDTIDCAEIRSYLGALNCLYGAPEALQLQALNSVYDHVRTLQQPEKVIQQVLDIMWSDGYISRQAMQSWFGQMDQAIANNFKGISLGDEKDLGELLQERMRAGQDMWRWIGDTTPLYHLPHYQRVALYSLCQLAVTWQGDKCTVDKDLLFHYVPQLFSDVRDRLQLLYAVQCVLYHLQKPPGLAIAVFQAVLTITRLPRESSILTGTTTDWDKWRNTQNPTYGEGRNIIQQQEQLLDLIVLISSKQTLNDINGWISESIPLNQMLDAFIIAAVGFLNREEEMALISDWISQNVPQSMQTVVQESLKTITIHKIPSRADSGLTSWMDKNILPAWRRDAQFVRAVMKAVCERTIHLDDTIDCAEIRSYLGSLNCLYGAPEALQLHALDSVYGHVRTLQHPEKVLQQVLDIMWSDGYISRLTMQSWFHCMDQGIAIKFGNILAFSKKDLRELLQERMKARQEVRRWMSDTTQLGDFHNPGWYSLPHYQRVALHTLCELAITWQGDECTLDRDLLFHYIPQLFWFVEEKIQLLYVVQGVVYQLRNPPGLAEFFLNGLTSRIPPRTAPIITESHLEKWRKTEHPAYEEGRDIMLQAAKKIKI